MTTLESTGVEEVSLTDEHTSETFEASKAEPDLRSELDRLLASLEDQNTPEIAPAIKHTAEPEIVVPIDEETIVASSIHTGPATEGELSKILRQAPQPESAKYMVEKAEINRAAEEIAEDFDKNFVKKSMQQRGADILRANYEARTAKPKTFMPPRLVDRPIADAQVDEVAEIFDGMRAKTEVTPVAEKETVHHILPDFKPVAQETKEDSVDISSEKANDMEEFLSSMSSMKPEVKVEDTPVVEPKTEEDQKKVADTPATSETKTVETPSMPEVKQENSAGSAREIINTQKPPVIESPVKTAQPEVIKVEATRVKEEKEGVKSAEQTPEQIRIAALEKTNQELREQLRRVLEQQKINEERNNKRFEEFMKVLGERQKQEASLAEESRKTIEKLAKELAEKKVSHKEGVKEKKVEKTDSSEREIDANGDIVLTEAGLVHDAEPKRFPPRDSAEMYKIYIRTDKEAKQIKREVGLTSSEIGIAANKYFDDLVQKINTAVHNRNEMRKELRKEKHSIPKRIATLGLSGTYRRSAHDEGANKIEPEIKALDMKIKKMLAELAKTEKDTRKSPIKTKMSARKTEIKRLRAIAR